MEDLTARIQEILGTKEGQEKLKNVAQMLGAGEDNGKGIDLSKLNGIFSNDQKNDEPQQEKQGGIDLEGIDIESLLKFQNIFSKFSSIDDKNANLILALKPHLKPERQKKADEAVRIMKLLALLPVLKESGLLGSLGNMLGGG